MAPLSQHTKDCVEFLGDSCAEVNRWVDEFFSSLGPSHRKIRHHQEGIREARELFGDIGAKAATVHILRDCRHIPRRVDYESGAVDLLGLKKDWPVTAYVRYSEEDFRAMVNNELFGPRGLILWSFVNQNAVSQLLASSTRLSEKEIKELVPRWADSVRARTTLSPLSSTIDVSTDVPREARPYVESFLASKAAESLRASLGELTFASVPVGALVTPLVFLDGEYLENLKPELQSSGETDIVKFALPSVSVIHMRAAMDPSMRNVTFLSSDKTLAVGPCIVTQTPAGTEVKVVVGSNLSLILVGLFNGRLIIRNGIHRAFLLASMGIKDIPCILIKEQALPVLMTSAYPSFTPPSLLLPRPPLVIDYNNPLISLEAPLQRTQKVIRIAVDESVLPVD